MKNRLIIYLVRTIILIISIGILFVAMEKYLIFHMPIPQTKLLGDIDITKINSITYNFISPADDPNVDLSIEIIDNGIEPDIAIAEPIKSDIVFNVLLKKYGNVVANKEYSKENLSGGNWHQPNGGIIGFGLGSLQKGAQYELTVNINKPDNLYNNYKSRSYIDYLDTIGNTEEQPRISQLLYFLISIIGFISLILIWKKFPTKP